MKRFCAVFVMFCVFVMHPASVWAAVVTPAVESNPSTPHVAVCGSKSLWHVRCHAEVLTNADGSPQVSATPSGYGPSQFRGAYNVDGTTSTKKTIAIVDAYDNPTIFSDLNVYSQTFGLPKLAQCPVASGTASAHCFQKVGEKGTSTLPRVNGGWALEIALDVEVVHVMCENCNILLVEASSSSMSSLATAFDTAVKMGATIISNSYGGPEFNTETSYDKHFNYPGIAILFSAGDSGYGAEYPAASQYVTAVGGTSLHMTKNTAYKSENAWSGTGSGCSIYEVKPAWQQDSGCLNRTIADIAADADPHTGAAVYDSTSYSGQKGWFVLGGTSLAAPLVAGILADSKMLPRNRLASSLFYNSKLQVHDVTNGSNGSCDINYLCHSKAGFDGPTGQGTPNGAMSW